MITPKERPILFNTEMVRAIMEGRKTQTRRIIKPQPIDLEDVSWATSSNEPVYIGVGKEQANIQCNILQKVIKSPKGTIGDLLWVRETFARLPFINQGVNYVYKANPQDLSTKWKPSIHMPKHAARIWLKVTGVAVERLQDISEKDAQAEGIEEIHPAPFLIRWKNYCDESADLLNEPVDSFRSLWQSINEKRGFGWDANPWVWVYTFEIVSTTGWPAANTENTKFCDQYAAIS